MHFELHPMLIHFPIAFFIGALGLELVSLIFRNESLHRTAVHLYLLAAFTSVFAVLTGWEEAESLHLRHQVLNFHKTFAFLTLGISWASLPLLWFFRKREDLSRQFFAVVVILCAFCVVGAAYNGGRLVYEYGVGVQQSYIEIQR